MNVYFNSEKVLYQEQQQFRQAWLWVLLVFGTVMSLLPVVLVTMHDNQGLETGLLVGACVLVLEACNIALFYTTKFETYVTINGIYYRWWPFYRKYTFISRTEIEQVSIERWTNTYWGFSKSEKYGRSHTVKGDMGILVILKNGKRYYVGSQDVLLLLTACERAIKNQERFAV